MACYINNGENSNKQRNYKIDKSLSVAEKEKLTKLLYEYIVIFAADISEVGSTT